jgi:hypothetical protein
VDPLRISCFNSFFSKVIRLTEHYLANVFRMIQLLFTLLASANSSMLALAVRPSHLSSQTLLLSQRSQYPERTPAPRFNRNPRQKAFQAPTCGYNTGDPNQPRTADAGFDCRVDTKNALWGFCPTTVIAAVDCGLAGNCVDRHACRSGCGISEDPSITTFTWYVDESDLPPMPGRFLSSQEDVLCMTCPQLPSLSPS